MKYLSLFLISILFIAAEAKTTAEFGVGAGVRKNYLQSIQKNSGDQIALKEIYHDTLIKELNGSMRIFWNRFFVEADASVGWFENAKMKTVQDLPFDHSHLNYRAKTDGKLLSGSFLSGIPMRFANGFYLAPILGYSIYLQEIERHHVFPEVTILENIFPFETLIATYEPSDSALTQIWKGPFIGAKTFFILNPKHTVSIRYSYHFLDLRERNTYLLGYFGKDALDGPVFETDILVKRHVHQKGKGHQLSYEWIIRPSPHWDLGLNLNYFLFVSGYHEGAKETKIMTVISSPDDFKHSRRGSIKFFWESIAFYATISRRF